MGLFTSRHERREAERHQVLVAWLMTLDKEVRDLHSTLHTLHTTIMASQAELAAELAAKTAQIRKAIDEITSRLENLEEAVRNSPATPELVAAVDALGIAVQAADDIVPDAPTPQA